MIPPCRSIRNRRAAPPLEEEETKKFIDSAFLSSPLFPRKEEQGGMLQETASARPASVKRYAGEKTRPGITAFP